MPLPRIEEITTKNGSVYQIWARDSGAGHVDISVDLISGADKDDLDQFDKTLFHPVLNYEDVGEEEVIGEYQVTAEDEIAIDSLFDKVKTSLTAGEFLEAQDTKPYRMIAKPKYLSAEIKAIEIAKELPEEDPKEIIPK